MGQSVARDYCAIAERYTADVVAGFIPACHWIRKACERQIEDRKREGTDGFAWIFDVEMATKFCKFAELMPHIKGRWKSPTITLEPWQIFVFTTIFGWVDSEGFRRFRKALIVLPRKNGKSAMASIVGLYGLALDNEPGAEIYSAATSRDQAKIVWDVSRKMALKTPGYCLRYGVSPLAHSIAIEDTASYFKPLSRDADSLEGLNPHIALIDELHAHSVREVFDVLDEATGARRQSLIFIISTEGDNPVGVFAEQVDYAEHILEGRKEDDSYFAVIYTIDKEDDWRTPESWRKANPNLGISLFEEGLAIRCKQAQANPASQSSFLTKRLNVRVGASAGYFNMLAWRGICKDTSLRVEDFYGAETYIGLDLASKNDIAAKVLLCIKKGKAVLFGKYYLPELCIEKDQPNYDVYRSWADQGYLTLTPGNTIDFEFIERDLLVDYKNHDLVEVAYDPTQARELATRMTAEGLKMVDIPQGFARMSEPMKDLAARIISGKIQHDGNPMLDWMIGNTTAKSNARESVMPDKVRPASKIDGAVCAIMALSRYIFSEQSRAPYSGLRSVG